MANLNEVLQNPIFLVITTGLVGFVGGYALHWLQTRKEDLKEDLDKIYIPIHRLLKKELDAKEFRLNRPEVRSYYDLDNSLEDCIEHRLLPRVFKRFRSHLLDLVRLSTEAASMDKVLDEIVKKELSTNVDRMRKDPVQSGLLNPALFQTLEYRLLFPLRKDSIEDVKSLIKEIKEDNAIAWDKDLFGTNAEDLFYLIKPKIKEARDVYLKAAGDYFTRLESVQSRLTKRLAKRARY